MSGKMEIDRREIQYRYGFLWSPSMEEKMDRNRIVIWWKFMMQMSKCQIISNRSDWMHKSRRHVGTAIANGVGEFVKKKVGNSEWHSRLAIVAFYVHHWVRVRLVKCLHKAHVDTGHVWMDIVFHRIWTDNGDDLILLPSECMSIDRPISISGEWHFLCTRFAKQQPSSES